MAAVPVVPGRAGMVAMLAKGSELPGWVIAAVPAFGVAVYALMSWLERRPLEDYYPPERPVRYREAPEHFWGRAGRIPARDTWEIIRGDGEVPLRGQIERRGWHPAGTALAMPPKSNLSPEYRAYIASPEWRARSRAFLMANPRCQLKHPGCTRRATQAHHRDYSELFHETARTLQAVCASCHAAEEWHKVRRIR